MWFKLIMQKRKPGEPFRTWDACAHTIMIAQVRSIIIVILTIGYRMVGNVRNCISQGTLIGKGVILTMACRRLQ